MRDFLTEHQELVDAIIKIEVAEIGTPGFDKLIKRIQTFLIRIEEAIDAAASVHDHYKFQKDSWDKRARQLCQMRDMIITQKERMEDATSNN